MLHSGPDRRLPSITTSQRGTSGNAAAPIQTFISLGGITDITQIGALNTLYSDLNTAGLWDKLQVLYPFVGGTSTAHALNLKDATQYPLTFTGSIVHNSNGISGTASLNASISSNYNMSSLSANDFSFGMYMRSPIAGSSSQNLSPFSTSTNSTYLTLRGDAFSSSQTKLASGSATNSGITGTSTAKFIAISSNSPTTAFSLINQVEVLTAIIKGSTLTGTILASLSSTTAGAVAHTMSIWYVATAMTISEVQTLNAIFQKYNDTLDTAFSSTRGTDYYINPNFNPITNRFISNGGVSNFSSTEKNALDYLTTSLISSSGSLWDKIVVLYPIASSTNLTATLRELKSSGSNSAVVAGTATTSATGLSVTASGYYLSTPIIPYLGSQSIGMYITEDSANNGFDIQCNVATRYDVCIRNGSGDATVRIYNGVQSSAANSDARGFYILDAPGTASSVFTLYKNNTALVTHTAGTTQSTGVYFLGKSSSSLRDVGVLLYTNVRLNSTERDELGTIINTYLTMNGRI